MVLLKIADHIEQNLELLIITESLDNGKAVCETLNADIPLAADHFRYFAGCISAAEIDGNTVAYHIHEACEELERLLKVHPANRNARLTLIKYYLDTAQEPKAQVLLQSWKKINIGDPAL